MKKNVITILILAAAVSLAGCGTQSYGTTETAEAEAGETESAEEAEEAEEEAGEAEAEEAEEAEAEEAEEAEDEAGEADAEEAGEAETEEAVETEEGEAGTENALDEIWESDVEEGDYETVDWDLDLIEDLGEIISGVEDMEFVAGEATRADIREPLQYDEDLVRLVMIETGDVSLVAPGEYEMEYDICFNREPLLEWMEENGIDSSLYPGMDSDAGRLFVTTTAGVTVTEAP